MNIINLQANDVVVLVRDDAQPVTFKSQGNLQVRMKTEDLTQNKVVKRGYWTHTRGLPQPKPDTLYIVSSLVAMFELLTNHRLDLLYPWGMVRSTDGKVIACRALVQTHLPPSN